MKNTKFHFEVTETLTMVLVFKDIFHLHSTFDRYPSVKGKKLETTGTYYKWHLFINEMQQTKISSKYRDSCVYITYNKESIQKKTLAKLRFKILFTHVQFKTFYIKALVY